MPEMALQEPSTRSAQRSKARNAAKVSVRPSAAHLKRLSMSLMPHVSQHLGFTYYRCIIQICRGCQS